jgi:hypothetical protein
MSDFNEGMGRNGTDNRIKTMSIAANLQNVIVGLAKAEPPVLEWNIEKDIWDGNAALSNFSTLILG